MPEKYKKVLSSYDSDDLRKLFGMGMGGGLNSLSPFSGNDATMGLENEFQTAVRGKGSDVDLPVYIRDSRYLRNMIKRAERGDTSGKTVSELLDYIREDRERLWENSWVRFPRRTLSGYCERILQHDLLSDKSSPLGGQRKDRNSFVISQAGEEYLRVPVSYLLKLALADSVSGRSYIHPFISRTGESFLSSFLNDNTSPEIVSFFPVDSSGASSASENLKDQNLKSYLLTQLLVLYANKKFELSEKGQQVSLYCSPHPPLEQKRLNELISDSFYRDIYMSPCLSGWDRGEEKHEYMRLCHTVLSRSSLNSVLKLREAGIISGNRVYLKGISNISLANNGTHISMGSRMLDRLMNGDTGFGPEHEKYFADLAVKITEHFLPLSVNSYTADPCRLNFWDFYPEKVMGFLAHELDFTHMRMIWRRWKKKADLSIFGNPVTPFGPEGLERLIAKIFRLRGDFVNDFRLLDYLVALMSTPESPALNGMPGNDEALKQDLASLGVFDEKMSLYMLFKQRISARDGYSGFEGRHYSLFPSLEYDLKHAANLQLLVTALAYKYIINGQLTHAHIPDGPEIESERRQAVFASSIGLPTFYVKRNTGSSFMMKIVSGAKKSRNSGRYQGYIRVRADEYRKSLLEILKRDGADLIEQMGMEDTIGDLEMRINEPDQYSAGARLTSGILDLIGEKDPMKVHGDTFNEGAEKYYRENLREKHMDEALDVFVRDLRAMETGSQSLDGNIRSALQNISGTYSGAEFAGSKRESLKDGSAPLLIIRPLIHLLLLVIKNDMECCSALRDKNNDKSKIRLTV